MGRIIDGCNRNMVGHNVKKYRRLNKMSQQELADKLELMAIYVCRGSVSRIEDRSRTVTDIELYGIAKVLKISIQDLYDKENDFPQS
ncbi:MAG: helix-turn-helix transcriptional regulator [Angelakisella sp.]|jgi:transcriptional regulator with XRE-family HTH domain|nr:helix-turn-helix transcriptional regulator [Angelakisella sp.]